MMQKQNKNLFCCLKIITQALVYFPHRLVYATLTKILFFELKQCLNIKWRELNC